MNTILYSLNRCSLLRTDAHVCVDGGVAGSSRQVFAFPVRDVSVIARVSIQL